MGYHLREGFRSIFTHGLMSFAAVCMILACLIIMGSFSLVAINIDNTLGRYEAENEFIAYIDETLAEDEARALQSKLEAIPNVSSVTFMTAGEALERYKNDPRHKAVSALCKSIRTDRAAVDCLLPDPEE